MSVKLEDLPPAQQTMGVSKTMNVTTGSFVDQIIELITESYLIQAPKQLQKVEEIGIVDYTGFELDLNKMITDKKYRVNYDGSQYIVLKNKKGELEIKEIEYSK